MDIIFLFPTELEAAHFRKIHPTANSIICGVGMATAAATMAEIAITSSPELVILAGIAGAYDTSHNPINQVVEVVSEVIEELPARFIEKYTTLTRFGLPTATSNSVNRSYLDAEVSNIENMEGAAVMAICNRLNIPFTEIRAISNRVGDPSHNWHFESAINSLTEVLSDIYKRTR